MPATDISIESVHQAYLENADYDVDCSVAKASAFVVAIRRMVAFAQSSSNQSSSMSFDLATLQQQRKVAEMFIAANDTTAGGASVVSAEEFNCFGFAGYERGGYR